MRRRVEVRCLLLSTIAAFTLHASGIAGLAQTTDPVGPKLPSRVRGLLVQEMISVLGASQQILGALVRADHEIVAEQAQAIHDSFILKQEMTDEDRKALRDAVPADFVKRDRAFHELSASLAEAARQRDVSRQRELFGRMLDACVGCHQSYATDRFPAFQPEEEDR